MAPGFKITESEKAREPEKHLRHHAFIFQQKKLCDLEFNFLNIYYDVIAIKISRKSKWNWIACTYLNLWCSFVDGFIHSSQLGFNDIADITAALRLFTQLMNHGGYFL